MADVTLPPTTTVPEVDTDVNSDVRNLYLEDDDPMAAAQPANGDDGKNDGGGEENNNNNDDDEQENNGDHNGDDDDDYYGDDGDENEVAAHGTADHDHRSLALIDDEALEDEDDDDDDADEGAVAAPPAGGHSFVRSLRKVQAVNFAEGKVASEQAFCRALAVVQAERLRRSKAPHCPEKKASGEICHNLLRGPLSFKRGVCNQCWSRRNNYYHPDMVAIRKEMQAERDRQNDAKRAVTRAKRIEDIRMLAKRRRENGL